MRNVEYQYRTSKAISDPMGHGHPRRPLWTHKNMNGDRTQCCVARDMLTVALHVRQTDRSITEAIKATFYGWHWPVRHIYLPTNCRLRRSRLDNLTSRIATVEQCRALRSLPFHRSALYLSALVVYLDIILYTQECHTA